MILEFRVFTSGQQIARGGALAMEEASGMSSLVDFHNKSIYSHPELSLLTFLDSL